MGSISRPSSTTWPRRSDPSPRAWRSYREKENLTVYGDEAVFVDDRTVEDVTGIIHAHPALNKAVQYAFEDVPV